MKPEQVEQCAEQLMQFHSRFASLLYEKRQAHWAHKWLHGLLLEGVRKNAAGVARAVPGGNVQSMQQFMSDSPWEPRRVVRELQAVIAEELGDPQAVLVCDETGFPKKGDKSVGVARQYSGTLGKVDNCQVGVFCAYVGKKGQQPGRWGVVSSETMGQRQKAPQGGRSAKARKVSHKTPNRP